MVKKRRILFFLILSVVVVVAVVTWVKRPKPIAVILAKVETGEVERTVTNTRAGTLKACRRAKLSPSIGGQIANLPVREGDSVKAGQILFEIWNDDLLAQVALAKSEFQASQARAKEACVQAEVSEREAERLNKLLKKGLASDEGADKAMGLAQARRAACEAVKSSIDVNESKIAVAQANLRRTRLTAPFDGIIAEVNGELGEYVTPSPIGIPTPPAVDLLDTSCLYVAAPIDEVDAPEIKAGMTARISLDAFGRDFLPGEVRRVAPYVLDVEKQARTVDIEVEILSHSKELNMLPGYSADVEVVLDEHKGTLYIPTEALLEGHKVYVYDAEDHTITEVAVKVGLSNWQATEILEGLTADQQIVTSIDREGLMDGALVKPEGSDKTTSRP
jgi:HlyD family secretion protein